MVFNRLVIPANAGIQFYMFMVPCSRRDRCWIPACAGMTYGEPFQSTKVLRKFIYCIVE